MNGTDGVVIDFMSVPEARANRIPIGSTDIRERDLFLQPTRKRPREESDYNEYDVYPLVRFTAPAKNIGSIVILCVPHRFEVDTMDGNTHIATRRQVRSHGAIYVYKFTHLRADSTYTLLGLYDP